MYQEVLKLCKEMSATTSGDAVWWGSESKTQAKILKDVGKEIVTKLKKATDNDTNKDLVLAQKMLNGMLSMVEVVSQHGYQGEAFQKEFDAIEARLRLEPTADIPWPDFIKWSRNKLDIQGTIEDERWLARIASESLESNGVPKNKLAMEQCRLISERLARYLKADKGELAQLFNMDRTYMFEEKNSEICSALSTILHFQEMDDLEDRIDLLNEGLTCLQQAIPDKANKVPGDLIGSTLIRSAVCRSMPQVP
jgi:polyhydroxyalkanoate synthesis regulator phasin